MAKSDKKVVNTARLKESDLSRFVGQCLRGLRELAGLTQSDLAVRLNVGQAAISKIESRGDVKISSLKKYVEALGANIRIEAVFGPGSRPAYNRARAFDFYIASDEKIVFPILGGDIFKPRRDVVLSVRPIYSEKILEGKKTVELRRRFPISAASGTVAYIYSTSPVRAMVGSAQIDDVIKMPVKEIWDRFGGMAQIDRVEFESYFEGVRDGVALKISNARAFSRPKNLDELRQRFGFEPPQSFLYVSQILRVALENECADVSD
ncbi:helix-turn-helix domain-containing protein [Microbaculum marinisediminis]|uniref:Helix-turn-helix domain-containing protein n=1 Tax=Microbaculum marinisediminis TaxID=2931392 RepID=A0AAW5QRW7_9HYPH|nr:helix-turn-helix domain-containing protein [Microbaculum sp. A6E488]MCT8970710.1 helix-turn-helix domain-containing protein [Microbaculum sp. A6E488]